MLVQEWSRVWKRVPAEEVQQAAEAQNRELEGIRSETEAETEAAEVKQSREVPEQ